MVFRNNILAGVTLVRNAIQSSDYVANTSGWAIRKDGTAEFNDVSIRGSLTASDGSDTVIVGPSPNPRIEFYKSGIAEPAVIVGERPFGTGVTGIQFSSASTSGHDQAIMQLDEFGFRIIQNTADIVSFGADFETDPEAGWIHAEHPGGISAMRGDQAQTWVSLVVDGKVGTGTTTTGIGTTDTNITSANAVNVPVILNRAYRVIVQLDYYRSSTGALARLDMKLWNGAVGGTQLGGTSRIPMAGPLSTARRTAVGIFIFRASTTETISNLNVSLATTDGTVGQNWTAEVNAGYSIIVEEIGSADLISNL